jgi:hypothetical protein
VLCSNFKASAQKELGRRRRAVQGGSSRCALVMNLQFSILMARRQIRQAGARLRDSSHERLLALTPGGEGIALERGRKRPGQPQQRAEHVDALQGTWRALPEGGLLQGSRSSSRQCEL